MHTITRSFLAMDTSITVKVVTSLSTSAVEQKLQQAESIFRTVEVSCSRFDPSSEVMQLIQHVGTFVSVSPALFEAIAFACEVAELTRGTFDPTVGQTMEKNGFNRHYLTGRYVETAISSNSSVSYRDILLDRDRLAVRIEKPLVIDLGAVAKGLAIDLTANLLKDQEGFMIDAGGDLFVFGKNEHQQLWNVGIRHPLEHDKTICSFPITNAAICTSGSYERKSKTDPAVHHLVNPHTNKSPSSLISATVIAPFAMMADALSTAAFLQGSEQGLRMLEEAEVNGVLITPDLNMYMTKQMEGFI